MLEIKNDLTFLQERGKKIPSYVVVEEFSSWGESGLYFVCEKEIKSEYGKEKIISKERICPPIYIEANTANETNEDVGILIRFWDVFEKWKIICVPDTIFSNGGEELMTLFRYYGFRFHPSAKNKIINFINWDTKNRNFVTSVDKTGWLNKRKVFVLPEKIIGAYDVFMKTGAVYDGNASSRGTAEEWSKNIAEVCANNPILVTSLCVSFAAPVLKFLNEETGGVNWKGDSSRGKTTTLDVSRSVWGGPDFKRTWQATANGLEAVAAMMNDTCLCLDELSQSDPALLGNIVYSIGNGTGKTRMNIDIRARPTLKWRCTIVSTGEKTIATHMKSAKKDQNVGQIARIIDVGCTDRKYGVFDDIHDFPSPANFSDYIKKQANTYYGSSGIKFVEKLIDYEGNLPEIFGVFKEKHFSETSSDLEGRVSKKFALWAMAGEMAISFGVLPFDRGHCLECVKEVFSLWKEGAHKNNDGISEDEKILEMVAGFIEMYGDSRFENIRPSIDDRPISKRAGWYEHSELNSEARTYYFTQEGLKEAVSGFDLSKVKNTLVENGWIVKSDKGRVQLSKKINGVKTRVFAIEIKDRFES